MNLKQVMYNYGVMPVMIASHLWTDAYLLKKIAQLANRVIKKIFKSDTAENLAVNLIGKTSELAQRSIELMNWKTAGMTFAVSCLGIYLNKKKCILLYQKVPQFIRKSWSYTHPFSLLKTKTAHQTADWYKKATYQENAISQTNLGIFYYNKQDYAQAAELYKKAADQGFARAQYNLGVCYEHGQGVNQDYDQAADWYKKAADQGNTNAQEALKKLKKT